MNVAKILRKGVGILDKQTKSLTVSVQHYRWVRTDPNGDDHYDSTVLAHQAIVDESPNVKYTKGGVTVPVAATILILRPFAALVATGRINPVDPRDMFKLPSGLSGQVLETPGVTDPGTGYQYFSEVRIGVPESRRTTV